MRRLRFLQSAAAMLALAIFSVVGADQADEKVQPPIQDGMNRLAAAVAEFFQTENLGKVVSVGAVVNSDGEGSELLKRLLQESLIKQDFKIEKGTHSVDGRFSKDFKAKSFDGVSESHKSVALKVTASIRNSDDDEIQKIAIPIFGEDALQVLGPTVEMPPAANEAARQQKANESLEKPKAVLVQSETRPTEKSSYGLEILVRRGKETEARNPTIEDGQSFVNLEKGEEYVVRLHNRTNLEAGVTLTIDGLNMFAFSEEGNFGSQVLIPRQGFVDIPGWYITSTKTDAFEITTYAKSAAGSKGLTGGVGTITAAFRAAWDPAGPPPADEVFARGADSPATGRGRKVDQRYEQVQRVSGKVRAFISVRYNR